MLLQLREGAKSASNKGIVQTLVGGKAKVTALTQRRLVECRGQYDGASEEEVVNELKSNFGLEEMYSVECPQCALCKKATKK
ncbi:hypothetical protein AND_000226 [Anopheles darlingi]|uniref:Uncharacterized protein n=1 Tax=Anopheles darlingi TaxID=43151 RepID=W5JX94_ANODA|nr:hypothetical protein AND_000226 [Anopheles darlingi]